MEKDRTRPSLGVLKVVSCASIPGGRAVEQATEPNSVCSYWTRIIRRLFEFDLRLIKFK